MKTKLRDFVLLDSLVIVLYYNDMTQTLTVAKAKQDFTRLVTNTQKKKNKYVITMDGAPAAMLVPTDEYESMKETYEILSDKKLVKDLKRAEKDIENGKFITLEQLKKELGR